MSAIRQRESMGVAAVLRAVKAMVAVVVIRTRDEVVEVAAAWNAPGWWRLVAYFHRHDLRRLPGEERRA